MEKVTERYELNKQLAQMLYRLFKKGPDLALPPSGPFSLY